MQVKTVVCGNQQREHDLPTRATTLAIILLRVLLALTAKFNLKALQLDAINAFVHALLDEIVFIKMPPRYREWGKVLRLYKALYGLRRSPLLWQQKLTDQLKALGFEDPLRAMHSSTKRYHLFLLCRRHSLCFQKRPTSRGWKDSSLAVRKSADQKKWRVEMVLRTPCDSKSIKAKHMVHRKPTSREYVMLSLLLCRIRIRIDYLLSPWML